MTLGFVEPTTLKIFKLSKLSGPWLQEWHNWLGLIMFLLLTIGLYLDARREKDSSSL